MLELLRQPWPWYVAGPAIAFIVLAMLLLGKVFGISSTMRTGCAMLGAGKKVPFFAFDWKAERWNLVFVIGAMLGGALSATVLANPAALSVAPATVQALGELGIAPARELIPTELFNWANLFTLPGFVVMVIGGFLIGFGARYAGGCTSGHAISGLSNVQWPSLLAVAGFFIGGLAVSYFVLPLVLGS